jgi:hypothetical protein
MFWRREKVLPTPGFEPDCPSHSLFTVTGHTTPATSNEKMLQFMLRMCNLKEKLCQIKHLPKCNRMVIEEMKLNTVSWVMGVCFSPTKHERFHLVYNSNLININVMN